MPHCGDISGERARRYVKRYSTSGIIREMQIKTTMRCYLTLVRMAVTKKDTDNICWQRCGEKGTVVPCGWECKLAQPLWKTAWRFLKKLTAELPNDPAVPLLGIHLKKTDTLIRKDTHTPSVHGSIIHNCWDVEATYTSIKRWIDKEDTYYIYI